MARPITIVDPKPLTISMSGKFYKHLHQIVARESSRQGKNIPVGRFVKEVLEHAYPMQKDESLFEKKT